MEKSEEESCVVELDLEVVSLNALLIYFFKSSSVYQKSLEDDISVKMSISWFLNTITHGRRKSE